MICTKRQREINHGKEQFRCIHRDATTYRELVSLEQCLDCPLKKEPKTSCAPVVDLRPYWQKRGLGDWVEKVLSKLGITKQRYTQVAGDCGCSRRQEDLNRWGERWPNWLAFWR